MGHVGLVDSIALQYFLVSVWSLINLTFPNTGLWKLHNNVPIYIIMKKVRRNYKDYEKIDNGGME